MRLRAAALIALVAVLAPCRAAASASTRSIDVTVNLLKDGSAKVTEVHDVSIDSGTERYIVKDNLDGIRILDLEVMDENGTRFVNIGEWDIDASMARKTGKCGIVHKSGGVELCWGIGSYGDHRYTVSYTMTGALKGLRDYDMLFLTCVNKGISPLPESASLKVFAEGVDISSDNARMWGFGFEGTTGFSDGTVFARSNGRFSSKSHLTVLVRLDKGLFSPSATIDRDFQHYLDMAMEGADFSGEDDGFGAIMAFLFNLFIVIMLLLPFTSAAASGKVSKREKRKLLGMKPSEVQWNRDIPADCNLAEAYFIVKTLGEDGGKKNSKGSLSAALILKMLQDGLLGARKDEKDRIEFTFDDSRMTADILPDARSLYHYMQVAAGDDRILQNKEFKKWAARNGESLQKWSDRTFTEGKNLMNAAGCITKKGMKTRFTEKGQQRARELYGLKKFLNEFSLVGERCPEEVLLWQNYLIYAALFGIAEKVQKDLQTINPELYGRMFENSCSVASYDVIRMSNSFSRQLSASSNRYAAAQATAKASAGGFGGHSSFGGGMGSFGGGFGGGSR